MKLARPDILTPRREILPVRGSVLAILENIETGEKKVFQTRNIITDDGDIYYAQRAGEEAVTNAFDTLELGDSTSAAPGKTSDSDSITLIASTAKLVSTGYPQTNDGDADNTGSGVDILTWTFEYAAGDFNSADITDGIIVVAAHGAAAPVLTHFEFTGGSFEKTSSDTLKVIVNHEFLGV